MVLRPDRLCCSVAGENSTASADRGGPADNFLTSSPPVDITPPPPPAVGKGGSTTAVGLIPPVLLDLVFRPASSFCSVAGAGEKSTTSADICHAADLIPASFLLADVIRRVDPPFPAGRICRRGAFVKRPKGARWLPPPSGRQRGSNSASLSTTAAHFCISRSWRTFSAGVRLPRTGNPCTSGVHPGP